MQQFILLITHLTILPEIQIMRRRLVQWLAKNWSKNVIGSDGGRIRSIILETKRKTSWKPKKIPQSRWSVFRRRCELHISTKKSQTWSNFFSKVGFCGCDKESSCWIKPVNFLAGWITLCFQSWDSDNCDAEDSGHIGCHAVSPGKLPPTFRRIVHLQDQAVDSLLTFEYSSVCLFHITAVIHLKLTG